MIRGPDIPPVPPRRCRSDVLWIIATRIPFLISSHLVSKHLIFLRFWRGPGRFWKVREAKRIRSSKDHVKRPSWCRVMTKKQKIITELHRHRPQTERRKNYRTYDRGFARGLSRIYDLGFARGLSRIYDPGVARGLSRIYDPGFVRGLERMHDPGFVRALSRIHDPGSARGFSRICDPCSAWTLSRIYDPGSAEDFDANVSYAHDKLGKSTRKKSSKSIGRPREAMVPEPKSMTPRTSRRQKQREDTRNQQEAKATGDHGRPQEATVPEPKSSALEPILKH